MHLIFRCVQCHKPQTRLSNLTKDFWTWRVTFWDDCGTENPRLSLVTHTTVIILYSYVCNTFVGFFVFVFKGELTIHMHLSVCGGGRGQLDLLSRRTDLWSVKMVGWMSPAIGSFPLPLTSLPCCGSKRQTVGRIVGAWGINEQPWVLGHLSISSRQQEWISTSKAGRDGFLACSGWALSLDELACRVRSVRADHTGTYLSSRQHGNILEAEIGLCLYLTLQCLALRKDLTHY